MRIQNCDLNVDLRIIGQGNPSLSITVDEGDGVEYYNVSKENTKKPESRHYDEWEDQLSEIVIWLRQQSRLTNGVT